MFPFILLIGLAVYVGGRYAAAHAAADRGPNMHIAGELPAGPIPGPIAGPIPGPIAVLGEFLKRGQQPTSQVIMCAIAECETNGHHDLATDIIKTFIAPVVYRHQLERARNANVVSQPQNVVISPPVREAIAMYGEPPPTYTIPAAPPQPQYTQAPPMNAPPPQAQSGYDRFNSARSSWDEFRSVPRADEALPSQVVAPAAQAVQGGGGRTSARAQPPMPHGMEHLQLAPDQPTDDELIAQMMGQPPPEKEKVPVPAQGQPMAPIVTAGEVAFAESGEVMSHRNRPPTPPPAMAPMREEIEAPSPIDGVSDQAWATFAAHAEREAPMYVSQRHVGRYRQRRERLEELGIDPDRLIGSRAAQRAAFDIDMADAYHHAHASGMLGEYISRKIKVPGHYGPCIITLSGMLGVIQCAGLDAAVDWFTNHDDRKKFTYTTRMFLQTNGAF